jgi:hypothetical protein
MTFINYTQGQKIEKPNNLEVVWSKTAKGPKQDRQNSQDKT